MNKKITSAKIKEWLPLIVVAIVFVITFAVVWGIRSARLNDTKALTDDDLREEIVLSTGDMQIDGAMFTFYMYNTYRSFLDYYGDSVTSYYGLVPTTSLKLQNHPDGGTWYDFFAGIASTEARKAMVLAAEAQKAGLSLSAAERESIAEAAAALTDEELVNGITREDVSRALELQSLAAKYRTQLTRNAEISDSDLEQRAQADRNSYSSWEYRTYSIFYADPSVEGSDAVDNTPEEAEALAKALLASANEEEYLAWIADHLHSTKGSEPAAAEEEARTRSLKTGSAYNEGNELSEWAYAQGRKIGDITMIHYPDSARYTVYLMVSLPAVKDAPTVNVRHILVEEQALAEELLARWENGGRSAASFGELAEEYSTDTGSLPTGGRYANVAQGEMVAEFDAWCFDSSRQPGDSGLVQTDFGWHVMYFEGPGLPLWKALVLEAMQAEQFDALYASMAQNYTITVDSSVIARIPG